MLKNQIRAAGRGRQGTARAEQITLKSLGILTVTEVSRGGANTEVSKSPHNEAFHDCLWGGMGPGSRLARPGHEN
jgi:hypothetical protein